MAFYLKKIAQSFLLLSIFTVILGGLYPFSIYIINQHFFAKKANNSLLFYQEKVIGSTLIGQTFSSPMYFWGRPSVADQKNRIEQYNQYQKKHGLRSILSPAEFPPDFITTSASGVDPHISYESALIQLERVSRETGRYQGIIENFIDLSVEPRQYFFIGHPRVNVVKLNYLIYTNK